MPNDGLVNRVVLVESLEGTDLHHLKQIEYDLSETIRSNGLDIDVEAVTVPSRAAWGELVQSLASSCDKDGVRPVLHLDAHGCKAGVKFANGDLLTWEQFLDSVRPVNIKSQNHLILVLSACWGLEAVRAMARDLVNSPAPAFLIVGPEGLVLPREVDLGFGQFYELLITTGDFGKAVEVFVNLPTPDGEEASKDVRIGYEFAERQLLGAYHMYLKQDCTEERLIERVLLGAAERGMNLSESQLQELVERLRPTAEEFEEMKSRFLMTHLGDNDARFEVDFDECMASVEYEFPLRW